MNRITRKDLQAVVDRLNRLVGASLEAYVKEGDKYAAQIGNFHISGAYGGVALHRMVNKSGGVSDVFSRGHMPTRELYELIHAYICGFELASERA